LEREQKFDEAGGGEAREGTLARKPLEAANFTFSLWSSAPFTSKTAFNTLQPDKTPNDPKVS